MSTPKPLSPDDVVAYINQTHVTEVHPYKRVVETLQQFVDWTARPDALGKWSSPSSANVSLFDAHGAVMIRGDSKIVWNRFFFGRQEGHVYYVTQDLGDPARFCRAPAFFESDSYTSYYAVGSRKQMFPDAETWISSMRRDLYKNLPGILKQQYDSLSQKGTFTAPMERLKDCNTALRQVPNNAIKSNQHIAQYTTVAKPVAVRDVDF